MPYLQVHEFEALILTEPRSLRRIFPDDEAGLERLALSVRDLEPELINDDDPPSKRIPAPTMPPHAQPKTEPYFGGRFIPSGTAGRLLHGARLASNKEPLHPVHTLRYSVQF